jgi:hypothetical protein
MEEQKYKVGQHVFIISNNSFVMEMVIVLISGDFYTLRSVENYGSGMRLKGHRLYATKEETEAVMKNERQKRDANSGRSRRWYE